MPNASLNPKLNPVKLWPSPLSGDKELGFHSIQKLLHPSVSEGEEDKEDELVNCAKDVAQTISSVMTAKNLIFFIHLCIKFNKNYQ